jgi:DNA-binding response OmpR family regulator
METILLIEDNKYILENLTEYFEMEGFKIIVANNGSKGIELARAFIPDIIICYILMPEMNGYEVLNALLNIPETCELPFIFSTSISRSINREHSLKLGADDSILKPFELDSLLKMVKDLLISGSKRNGNPKGLSSPLNNLITSKNLIIN